MRQNKNFIPRLLSLFVVVLVLSAAAILRDGKLFGHDLRDVQATSAAVAVNSDTLSVLPDGAIVVNTKPLAKDIQGYGGPVPLRLHISRDGVVTAIEAEPNAESPDFFDHAKTLLARWQGKSVDEAMAEHVDAVSGATFSSKAIIANVQRGLAYAKQKQAIGNTSNDASEVAADASLKGWTVGGIVAVVVVLLGAIVPLFSKSRRWHYVQLVLNVVVLGLWTGHYCAHVCPFGSAQELAGKITRRKPRMSPRLNKALITFRNLLWGVLMALMLTGTWTAWMDYELFTAFLYTSASVWVIVLALAFLVLSVWVPRPFCRFVCPMGTLLRN